jgi:hypothetical protein
MKKLLAIILTLLCVTSAQSVNAAVNPDDLLGYWGFDNSNADVLGRSPDATFVGSAAFSADGGGASGVAGDWALDLGAVNDGAVAQVATGTHFDRANSTGVMAVSFSQLNTGVGNTSAFWATAPAATANFRGFQAHTPWGNGTIFFDHAGCCAAPGQRLTVDGQITTDVWQDFVFQIDGAGGKQIWVDGVLAVEQASGADPLLALDGGLTIGGEPPSANSFGGLIDNVAVWSSTIPEGDIFALANGATPLDIIPEPGAGLLALLSGLGLTFFKRRRR